MNWRLRASVPAFSLTNTDPADRAARRSIKDIYARRMNAITPSAASRISAPSVSQR
jgi:hypothetical protein